MIFSCIPPEIISQVGVIFCGYSETNHPWVDQYLINPHNYLVSWLYHNTYVYSVQSVLMVIPILMSHYIWFSWSFHQYTNISWSNQWGLVQFYGLIVRARYIIIICHHMRWLLIIVWTLGLCVLVWRIYLFQYYIPHYRPSSCNRE